MKLIKKILCGVISCTVAASLFGGIALGVTAADDFSVKISSETVEPGESYTLTLDMENIPSPGLNVCEFGISFDSSLVTVESIELGKLAENVTADENLPHPFAYTIDTDVVDVLFSDVSGTVLSGSGTFLSITGKVSETAAEGSEAVFSIVPIDRAVTPGSGTSNGKVIFGNLADDVTEFNPVLVSGKVSIKTTPVTTPATTAVTTTVTQTTTTIVTQPVTTTAKTTTTQPGTTIVTQPVTSVSTVTTTTVATNPVTSTSAKTTTTTPVTTTAVTTTTTRDDTLLGDINLDGNVTVADVVVFQKYFIKSKAFNARQFASADFNEDGSVNIFDLIALKRFIFTTV